MNNITSRKNNIKVQFIDLFLDDVGSKQGNKMMGVFKCKRVPALENFIAKNIMGESNHI